MEGKRKLNSHKPCTCVYSTCLYVCMYVYWRNMNKETDAVHATIEVDKTLHTLHNAGPMHVQLFVIINLTFHQQWRPILEREYVYTQKCIYEPKHERIHTHTHTHTHTLQFDCDSEQLLLQRDTPFRLSTIRTYILKTLF